jgi:prephenate dehydrogenase
MAPVVAQKAAEQLHAAGRRSGVYAAPMTVAIIGLGLIGGSLARALRRGTGALREEVIGVDADPRTLAQALAAGAIQEGALIAEAVSGNVLARADLVVLAVPGPSLLALVAQVAAKLAPGAVLTDVGGAKGPVVQAAAQQQHALFVGGHPMAGTEFRGFGASFESLFDGCTFALCAAVGGPAGAAASPPGRAAEDRVEALWRTAGAGRVLRVEPEAHDRAVTFASHLPYLAAAGVAQALISSGAPAQLARDLAAGGFRDTTRLAGDGTLAGAASQNRFLPEAARALAQTLLEWAGRLEQDPQALAQELGRLAEERRGMPLPPRR